MAQLVTCLDFFSVLEVDPGWHITKKLHKALLPRSDVQLQAMYMSQHRQGIVFQIKEPNPNLYVLIH